RSAASLCRGRRQSDPAVQDRLRQGLRVGRVRHGVAAAASDRGGAPAYGGPLGEMTGGTLVPVPGGVLNRGQAGAAVGAVGVSGDTSDNDEAAAVAGIEAAGFVAETGG